MSSPPWPELPRMLTRPQACWRSQRPARGTPRSKSGSTRTIMQYRFSGATGERSSTRGVSSHETTIVPYCSIIRECGRDSGYCRGRRWGSSG